MDDVAGYRVLRRGGRGDRAQLLLGFDGGDTVVLKVASTADPAVALEIAALDRAAGDHVVRLLDVAADRVETVVVLERLPLGSLAELLERRAALAAGEAVTILAPIATAVDRLHRAGVAHGALSLSSVCFRADGAPTLVGFGHAELFDPGAPEVVRETVPGVIADRVAVRALVAVVLARVAGPGAEAARRLAASLEDATPESVATQLFGLAAPAPVEVRDDADHPAPIRPPAADDAFPGVAEDPVRAVLPPWLTALVPEGPRERVLDVLARLRVRWESWEPRRRRLAVGAGVGGATLLLAMSAWPVPPPASAPTPTAPAAVSADPVPPRVPEDPVEAVVALLAERDRCLRDLSVLCLDRVDQAGSAALAEDAAEIRAILAGDEHSPWSIEPGRPTLIERLGDAVLLDLPHGSRPASIQLLRTDDGWRIRSYLDAPAVMSVDEMPSG